MEGRKVDDLWHRLSVCPRWASAREGLRAIDSERQAHRLQGLRVNRNSGVEGADPGEKEARKWLWDGLKADPESAMKIIRELCISFYSLESVR
mmetsp:Transcript_30704/g.60436  ORF Transcript_30704/g.60436 Transcript_30704/m.60436 type:complete len:93 (+) Transcript_30704:827-1105(+)